ncbi:hypothetical protein [Bosea sp. ANAM02]|uniref:hypothetical protein n=1 Tax=Bosea sp. ANAM02 TaxID=2020412 RepID=UPI001FCE4DC9|nr:hypothetical protein [Bosea sp. ANAM02]
MQRAFLIQTRQKADEPGQRRAVCREHIVILREAGPSETFPVGATFATRYYGGLEAEQKASEDATAGLNRHHQVDHVRAFTSTDGLRRAWVQAPAEDRREIRVATVVAGDANAAWMKPFSEAERQVLRTELNLDPSDPCTDLAVFRRRKGTGIEAVARICGDAVVEFNPIAVDIGAEAQALLDARFSPAPQAAMAM